MKKFSFHCKSYILFLLADEDTTLYPDSLSVEVEEDLIIRACVSNIKFTFPNLNGITIIIHEDCSSIQTACDIRANGLHLTRTRLAGSEHL